MSFDPKRLTPTVYEVYKKGVLYWIFTVRLAINFGYDLDTVTNIAFFLHHPELGGRPLKIGETELIANWKAFRTVIKPLLGANRPHKPAPDDVFIDGQIITAENPSY